MESRRRAFVEGVNIIAFYTSEWCQSVEVLVMSAYILINNMSLDATFNRAEKSHCRGFDIGPITLLHYLFVAHFQLVVNKGPKHSKILALSTYCLKL